MGWQRNWTIPTYERQRKEVHWYWQMRRLLSCAQLRQASNRFQIWQPQLPPSTWLASALAGRPVCREWHKSGLDTNSELKMQLLQTGHISLTLGSKWQCNVHTKVRTGSETDRQVKQTDKHGNIYAPVYRAMFLLPNVTNSNTKRIIRTESTTFI